MSLDLPLIWAGVIATAVLGVPPVGSVTETVMAVEVCPTAVVPANRFVAACDRAVAGIAPSMANSIAAWRIEEARERRRTFSVFARERFEKG